MARVIEKYEYWIPEAYVCEIEYPLEDHDLAEEDIYKISVFIDNLPSHGDKQHAHWEWTGEIEDKRVNSVTGNYAKCERAHYVIME